MFLAFDNPLVALFASLLGFWLSAQIGAWARRWQRHQDEAIRDDLTFILGGALTLLGLIIGFTFSMAVSRYDQRKNYEEQEANAIGTEYVRADLLPPAEAARVRELLRRYLDQRIRYYGTHDVHALQRIDAETVRLQAEMWSVVAANAVAQPTQVAALVASGMNDVLNSQGYTQAAWWNRIPTGAWALLISIAALCNVLLGFNERSKFLLLILPIVLAVTLFLIADIDSPRAGVIQVQPQNLQSIVPLLRAP